MTVGARVIQRDLHLALIADIGPTSHGRRAAEVDSRQGAFDLSRQTRSILANKVRRVSFEYAGDTQLGSFSGIELSDGELGIELGGDSGDGTCSDGSIHLGHWRAGSQSIGLGVDPKCSRRQCK